MAEFLLEAESKEGGSKGDEDYKFVMQTSKGLTHILKHGHTGMYDHIAHMPGVAGLINRSYKAYQKRNPTHTIKPKTHK